MSIAQRIISDCSHTDSSSPIPVFSRGNAWRRLSTSTAEVAMSIALFSTPAVDVLKRLHALPLEKTRIGDEESVGLQPEIVRGAVLMQRAPQAPTGRAG